METGKITIEECNICKAKKTIYYYENGNMKKRNTEINPKCKHNWIKIKQGIWEKYQSS
jgi:hypothetical protein